jgi:hypothetical protein
MTLCKYLITLRSSSTLVIAARRELPVLLHCTSGIEGAVYRRPRDAQDFGYRRDGVLTTGVHLAGHLDLALSELWAPAPVRPAAFAVARRSRSPNSVRPEVS